jgi:hypothetical protein
MVSWERAWSGAFAWLAWTLLYGIIGIILIGVGVFSIMGNINNITNLVSWDSKLIGGFLFIVAGWIIIVLGAIASFFKINSEIISEEVNSQ